MLHLLCVCVCVCDQLTADTHAGQSVNLCLLSLNAFSRYSAWSSCAPFWPTVYSWHLATHQSGPNKWSKYHTLIFTLKKKYTNLVSLPQPLLVFFFSFFPGTPSLVSIHLSHSQKLLPEVLPSMDSLFFEIHGTGWISWSFQWRKCYDLVKEDLEKRMYCIFDLVRPKGGWWYISLRRYDAMTLLLTLYIHLIEL